MRLKSIHKFTIWISKSLRFPHLLQPCEQDAISSFNKIHYVKRKLICLFFIFFFYSCLSTIFRHNIQSRDLLHCFICLLCSVEMSNLSPSENWSRNRRLCARIKRINEVNIRSTRKYSEKEHLFSCVSINFLPILECYGRYN